jgi:glutamate-1-semialdehyde 2,1-aminomutase
MVRYARTGGEAMAIAVRIARAYSKKDTVAFSGYHGFHDWYLAANLARQDSLDGHLLSGLEPNGVPRALKGTSIPFNHNCIDELEAITNKHEIGAIVLEPVRHRKPKEDFLPRVRAIADEIDAVLIFDEITSGWRMNTGGIHALFGVFPDVAVYGKAMSNGFPMAAVVGRREVMDAAQSSFISSTYWTERIGPTAALATIDKLRAKNVVPHLSDIGKAIGAGWKKSAKKHGLVIDVLDFVPPLITFSFEHDNALALHTLFTQEMLNCGYLASKSVYVSYAHTKNHVKQYLAHVDVAFETIKMGIEADNVFDLLKGPVAHTGFKRLT